MVEYISREDAFRAVDMQCTDGKMFGTDESDMTLIDASDVTQAIAEIPAADVALVVHCKDCVLWGRSYCDTHRCFVTGCITPPEHFCACGAKKEV